MKEKSLKLVSKNLQDYFQKIRFYKKGLEKTLAYILYKKNIVSSMTTALQLINEGNVQVNNKKMNLPNYICSGKDTISVKTGKGIQKWKLNDSVSL